MSNFFTDRKCVGPNQDDTAPVVKISVQFPSDKNGHPVAGRGF